MKIAILVVSRNRPDLVDSLSKWLAESVTIPHDLFIVECGTDRDKLSPYSTLWYSDPEFRGKAWGHSLALDMARKSGQYDYYFFLMNDLIFEPGIDAVRILVEQMEREPLMAILSPTSVDKGYPSSERRNQGGWHAVSTCDYLGFMMRASAIDNVGFLNPSFQYCWGAIHELAYKLYSNGWFIAYSDDISYHHLGGSTYGQKDTRTISREEYQQRAKRFAFEYFRTNYGDNWDEVFWEAAQGHGIEINTFRFHKELWSQVFAGEQFPFSDNHNLPHSPLAMRMQPASDTNTVRLHLGCGPEKREGWINIDTQSEVKPDIVSSVDKLPMFYEGSVDVIEANHLFEHLTYDQALSALVEWSRILKPGGELFLEMPDLDACIRMLGRHKDPQGFDIGMIGIYGYPPMITSEGMSQVHKWGWTRTTLVEALRNAGFEQIMFGPISQTWRVAAKFGRDIRLRAVRANSLQNINPDSNTSVIPAMSSSGSTLDCHDKDLIGTVQKLQPWFFPVKLGQLKVTPGIGSHVPQEVLENAARCRTMLLVEEVARRIDMRDKSILELACNCGYWSSQYARLGATRIVGLEGRDKYLQQAHLYWSTNHFLPDNAWSFIKGNISDLSVWEELRKLGPFDIVLCAGILYHVQNYLDILTWAAGITHEALIVDTRVEDIEETLLHEPGELYFNAIEETRVKVIPNRSKLLNALSSLGFQVEILPVNFPTGPGVDSVDDYAAGRRITVFARRIPQKSSSSRSTERAILPDFADTPIADGNH